MVKVDDGQREFLCESYTVIRDNVIRIQTARTSVRSKDV